MKRLLRGLPWYSLYRRAVQDDPDVAEAYASSVTDSTELEPSDHPSLREWDEHRELSADIIDAINNQTVSMISSQIPKGKPRPKFRPTKRPNPAMQRALKARRKELDSALEDDLMRQLDRG